MTKDTVPDWSVCSRLLDQSGVLKLQLRQTRSDGGHPRETAMRRILLLHKHVYKQHSWGAECFLLPSDETVVDRFLNKHDYEQHFVGGKKMSSATNATVLDWSVRSGLLDQSGALDCKLSLVTTSPG